jgi:hypothetical protein
VGTSGGIETARDQLPFGCNEHRFLKMLSWTLGRLLFRQRFFIASVLLSRFVICVLRGEFVLTQFQLLLANIDPTIGDPALVHRRC